MSVSVLISSLPAVAIVSCGAGSSRLSVTGISCVVRFSRLSVTGISCVVRFSRLSVTGISCVVRFSSLSCIEICCTALSFSLLLVVEVSSSGVTDFSASSFLAAASLTDLFESYPNLFSPASFAGCRLSVFLFVISSTSKGMYSF